MDKNIVLIGKPGSGKGTLSTFLKNEYDLIHLSTGELMREEIKSGSDMGKIISSYIDKGNFAPIGIATTLLINEIKSYPLDTRFIFDGYPRDLDQLMEFNGMMKGLDMEYLVMNLNVSDQTCKQRLQLRSVDSGRVDDAGHLLDKRFENHNKLVEPLLTKLRSMKNTLLIDIPGELSPEDVAMFAKSILNKVMEKNDIRDSEQ